mmetsp:Transcript_12236/g.39172  ORF Transcript_12236/g.39172 Transcript_12236/m.39172 type:complete len:358 (-) Transcript_12236:647-1720(-)
MIGECTRARHTRLSAARRRTTVPTLVQTHAPRGCVASANTSCALERSRAASPVRNMHARLDPCICVMGAATTSVARQRTPRCRASLAPRQRSCASRRGRPSAAAARGRRGRGRARAALQPPPHAREMRAALGAAATSSPAPPGRAQRRDEGGARWASAQSRPAAATSRCPLITSSSRWSCSASTYTMGRVKLARSLVEVQRSRGGEAKPGEAHRRHNERELLRLPVALPVAPRRGVQSDGSPSLRADDNLDVPHRSAGQRQTVVEPWTSWSHPLSSRSYSPYHSPSPRPTGRASPRGRGRWCPCRAPPPPAEIAAPPLGSRGGARRGKRTAPPERPAGGGRPAGWRRAAAAEACGRG